MAKIVGDQIAVVHTWQPWLRIIVTGASLGLVAWFLTFILARYVVDPLMCRDVVNAASCANSTSIAGNIATIFTGLLGLFLIIRLQIPRLAIIAVATAAITWNLAALTDGLALLEVAGWSIVVYALSYLLFYWITRGSRLAISLIVSLIIVVIIRIALVL